MIEKPFVNIVRNSRELCLYLDFVTYSLEKEKLTEQTKLMFDKLMKTFELMKTKRDEIKQLCLENGIDEVDECLFVFGIPPNTESSKSVRGVLRKIIDSKEFEEFDGYTPKAYN